MIAPNRAGRIICSAMSEHAVHISGSSLHQQVTSDLLARIQSGQLAPGQPIPTEAELCREYGVSRITIRRALSALVERRLVVRRPGIGSFVSGRQSGLREFNLIGFLDDRLNYSRKMLRDVVERTDPQIGAALGLESGDAVQHVCVLIHDRGDPFAIYDAYSADTQDRRMTEADFADPVQSAHAMGERLGRRIIRAEQELDAVSVDHSAATALGLPVGTPIIRARRVYYTKGDQPLRYSVIHYHPAHYRFIVDLMPRSGTSAFAMMPQQTGGPGSGRPKTNRNRARAPAAISS
jgi:DNA-binding GntR family transcriptional regulator